jgi:hypothetical protein
MTDDDSSIPYVEIDETNRLRKKLEALNDDVFLNDENGKESILSKGASNLNE